MSKFYISAKTKGGKMSKRIPVSLGVCARDSMIASRTPIDKVLERFSSNSRNEKNMHTIYSYEWRRLFKFTCSVCNYPSIEIVDASGKAPRQDIKVDRYGNIKIGTKSGMRFNGYLRVFFDKEKDKGCYLVNQKPSTIKFSVEICGLEKIQTVDSRPLSFTFMMGLDKSKVIPDADLEKLFKVSGSSKKCALSKKYQIVSTNNGKDYPLSPNLRSRFNYFGGSLKLMNIALSKASQ